MKILISLFLAINFMLLQSCANSNAQSKTEEDAMRAYNQKNFPEAIQIMKDILEERETDFRSLTLLGQLSISEKDKEGYELTIKQLKKNPDAPNYEKGFLAYLQGQAALSFDKDFDKAKEFVKEAWYLSPQLQMVSKLREEILSAQKLGRSAPDFNLDKVGTNGAEKVSLKSLRGKTVIIDFWATWCGPCRQTMPKTEALYKKSLESDKVVVLTVNLREDESKISDFMNKNKYQMTVLLDKDGSVGQAYEAVSIPKLVVIDPDGKLQFEGHPNQFDENTLTF